MSHSEIIINKQYMGLNPISFGYENCKPEHKFGPAVRSHWLLHYVSSGKGIFKRDGKEYKVRTGDIFVIPPQLETYYEADSSEPWSYIWIGFTCEGEPPAVLDPIVRCRDAGAIFEKMKRCREFESGKSAYLSGLIWQLMSMLLETPKQTASEADYIEKAISYLDAEYSNAVTVSEIAERLNLNRSYFSTAFKARTGMSPQQYLLKIRFENAARMMTEGKITPTVAAGSVGYTDIYQFSKMFKKFYGMSPNSYIKNYRTNNSKKKD